MERYTVEFVAHESITTMVPMFDAFKFAPKGRMQWMQRWAWKFLKWRRAMDQAYEPKVTITQHVIDADRFIERLLKQKRALFDGFGHQARRLLIGSDDYAELMQSPEVRGHHFDFRAEIGIGRSVVVGLTVDVVPWMRGMVVMP